MSNALKHFRSVDYSVAHKARYRTIDMKISDFLTMAKPGHDKDKENDVEELIDKGIKFESVPYLYFDLDGKDAKVTGHEGRHRARALQRRGFTTMPVELRGQIRWSEQGDPKRFDYVEVWPTSLVSEDGHTSIPFPIARDTKVVSRLLTASQELDAGVFPNIDRLRGIGTAAREGIQKELTHKAHEVSSNLKISKTAVVKAFQEPRMMNVLEACGYSFATLFGAFSAASALAHHGVMHTLAHVAEHEALHKVGHKMGHHEKVKSADRVLAKYPTLKKLAGPALAGVMLYGYVTGPTSKSLDGWDLTNVKKALTGEFTVGDLLHSPEMVSVAASLASGKAFSLTAMAESASALAIGLTCNAIIHSENPKLRAFGSSLKDSVERFRSKGGSPLADIASSPEFKPDSTTDKPSDKPKEAPKETPSDKAPKAKNPSWFDAMSDERQADYLKQHPASIYQPTKANVRADRIATTSIIQPLINCATKHDPLRKGPNFMNIPLTAQPDGSTHVGAGVLFYCQSTGRMLFVLRSPTSESPGTWCGVGGGVEAGETVEQGCRREVAEETRYTLPFTLMPMHKCVSENYVFHNYFAIIDEEFIPALNDEHTDYRWSATLPQPIHPKFYSAIQSHLGLRTPASQQVTAAPGITMELRLKFAKDLRANSKFFATWKYENQIALRFNADKTSTGSVLAKASKELSRLGWAPTKPPLSHPQSPMHAIRSSENYFCRKDKSFTLRLSIVHDMRGSTAYTNLSIYSVDPL
jgi:8-oxo-dGTP pyrophosphatase MutT (NUDIX family)